MLQKIVSLKFIITALFIAILFIPMYEVFVPYENKAEDECWEYRFIWEDFFEFSFYTFFVIAWSVYTFKPHKILRIFLIFFSIINFIAAFLSVSIPIQDFAPLWGTFVYLLLCLLVFIYFLFMKNYEKINGS